MAKISEEYIRRAFYRQFAALSPERKLGVIEGLLTIQDCMSEQAVLPLEEEKNHDGE